MNISDAADSCVVDFIIVACSCEVTVKLQDVEVISGGHDHLNDSSSGPSCVCTECLFAAAAAAC